MYATADLVDAFGAEIQSCGAQFRNFGRRSAFFGPVRTIKCLRDNALLKSVIGERSAGEVLVVDAGGSLGSAIVGDMLAAMAAQNGWAGLVIFGAVRDSAKLAQVDIGIKALGTNPVRSAKTGEGDLDSALQIGDARFSRGDWVYCDEDGVIVATRPIHLDLAS